MTLVIGIVDDDANLERTFARSAPTLFVAEHVVLQATTIADATLLLETAAPEGIDVILVDGYIPWSPTDGLRLEHVIRELLDTTDPSRTRHAPFTRGAALRPQTLRRDPAELPDPAERPDPAAGGAA